MKRRSSPTASQRVAAGLSYMLSLVSGLIVIFFVMKQNRFVRFHAMQSILFSGSVIALLIVLALLSNYTALSGTVPLIGGLLILVYPIGLIVLMLCGFLDKYFKLPLIGNYAERYANRGTM